MDHRSRANELIEEFVAYDKFLDEEKARIRPFLLALRGSGGAARTDTTEVLLEVFQDNPNEVFTAAEAETMIRERGWTTESADPVNAVRAALNRMKHLGQVENVTRGTYRLAQEDEDDQDEPEPESSYDDPWGSPPPPPRRPAGLEMAVSVPAADDEPPF